MDNILEYSDIVLIESTQAYMYILVYFRKPFYEYISMQVIVNTDMAYTYLSADICNICLNFKTQLVLLSSMIIVRTFLIIGHSKV